MDDREAAEFAKELGELLRRYNRIPVDLNEGTELNELSFVPAGTEDWEDMVTLNVFTDPTLGTARVTARR